MKINITMDLKINLKAFELKEQIEQNEKSKEVAEEELNEGFKRIIENMYEESKLADVEEINVNHQILMWNEEQKMKRYVTVWTVIIMLYMLIEYKSRGYFAFGAEILMPGLAVGLYPVLKDFSIKKFLKSKSSFRNLIK